MRKRSKRYRLVSHQALSTRRQVVDSTRAAQLPSRGFVKWNSHRNSSLNRVTWFRAGYISKVFSMSPVMMIVTAFLLMVAGVALPLLMVIHVVESTFFLNFLSYTVSLIGIFLGTIGIALYSRRGRK